MNGLTSWWNEVKRNARARWNRFMAKSTGGKIVATLGFVIVLYIGYRVLRWVYGWHVVQTYVVIPISRFANSLGLARFSRKVE